jgi:hypothetical protein
MKEFKKEEKETGLPVVCAHSSHILKRKVKWRPLSNNFTSI